MAMHRVVLPRSGGRLVAGVELLKSFVVDPNLAVAPVQMPPCPERERWVDAAAKGQNVVRGAAMTRRASEVEATIRE